MLQLLVTNTDAMPAPTILFLDLQTELPSVAKEDEAHHKPHPVATKEWMEAVYTFQDVQTQANLCTWIGEM